MKAFFYPVLISGDRSVVQVITWAIASLQRLKAVTRALDEFIGELKGD